MSCVVGLRAWPRAIALAVLAAAISACSSETSRFNSGPYASQRQPNEVTGSVPPRAPAGAVQTSTLPPPNVAAAPTTHPTGGVSGGGRGMASYQPGQSPDVTGSVASPSYNQRPHASYNPPPPQARPAPGRNGGTTVHVVAPGETLIRIARTYNIPLADLARLNNIAPHTKVNIGDRLTVPAGRGTIGGRTDPQKVASQPKALNATAKAKSEPKGLAAGQPKHTVAATQHGPQLASVATTSDEPPAPNAVRAGNSRLTFRWPAKGRIIAGFGPKTNGQSNDGINIALPEGTPIHASEDGVVAYAGNELKGYGNLVLIRHADGYVTAYAHAKELLVKRGDTIRRGQTIARSGQSGNVDAPQLHFEIRKGPSPIDPMPLLSGG